MSDVRDGQSRIARSRLALLTLVIAEIMEWNGWKLRMWKNGLAVSSSSS